MTLNITNIDFGGARSVSAGSLYQYDYGQILRFTDLNLPEAYEVHFARQSDAQTITMIGTADGVAVPDEMLLTAGHIKVYIYLHEGETDGETEYKAIIPVIARPEPSHEEPTPVQQSEITQLVAALNTAVGEAEGYAQTAQEAAESIPEHVLVYDEQTLTDAEKAQARANIGAIGSADIPTEIYWVTYQSTTSQQISSAINAGKYPVLKYGNGFDSPRIIAPLTNQFDGYTFECVQGSEFIQFVLSSGTWSMTRIRDHNIKYDAQSLTTSQKTQARSNIGAIAQSDVPTKVSELTNDSGYVTQWTAPVRSVNGQTGAVQLHSVLYDSQALTDLQKAQARTNIDVPSNADFDTVSDVAYEAAGKADWAVSYNPVQSLTDQEKADARANIDAVSADDVDSAIVSTSLYGYCDTGVSSTPKEVTISEITELYTGLSITVKFQNGNTRTNPTLKLNQFDAKPIMQTGTAPAGASGASAWSAGAVVSFTYDGTNWMMDNFNNTTYSTLSESDMQTGTATTGRLITAQRLKQAVLYHGKDIDVATTSANGLMSATDKSRLDDLYADYSSAMTALGV